jgi:hypothetical protein
MYAHNADPNGPSAALFLNTFMRWSQAVHTEADHQSGDQKKFNTFNNSKGENVDSLVAFEQVSV